MTTAELYTLFISSSGVSTDSRKISKGCIFFSLKGDNFNGNQYADEALQKGAAFAVIDENKYNTSNKTILVKNSLETLQTLARYHRKKLNIPILAITGTNGKTTTKELISRILSQKYKVGFTEGNLNNHIGVPLTLLSMNSETEIGIIEMGANHPGEIAELCEITDPNYGIITNIGKAHLEGFGSFEGVKKTKAELYNYLNRKNGIIFINDDNPILKNLLKQDTRVISYGTKNIDFTGEIIQSPPFLHLKANFPKGVLYINTKLTGNYNFENVMAAACIGNYFKVDPLDIQAAIKEYEPSNIRSQMIEKKNIQIIMDAYNANPTSMGASLESFLTTIDDKKNSFLILGDMLELGIYSVPEHQKILEIAGMLPTKNVFLVGKTFSEVAKSSNWNTFKTVKQLCDYLTVNPIKSGKILIKGSRGIQLEKVLDCFN